MVVDKKWFIAKINDFLKNDESNKMVGVDSSYIFEPNTVVVLADDNINKGNTIADTYRTLVKKSIVPNDHVKVAGAVAHKLGPAKGHFG